MPVSRSLSPSSVPRAESSRVARARRWAARVGVAAVLAIVGGPSAARADEPWVGSAQTSQGGAKEERRVLERARRDALEKALARIDGPVDAKAKARVLVESDAWTSSYRVLRDVDEGSVRIVEVEVDIDMPRLKKRVLPPPGGGGDGLLLSRVNVVGGGDGDTDRERARRFLAERGIDSASGRVSWELDVRWTPARPVAFTFMHHARVELTARVGATTLAAANGDGFAEDGKVAAASAFDAALERLVPELDAHARGIVRVELERPAPASVVRGLERLLSESVIGVTGVRVVAVGTATGSVILEVSTQLDAAGLVAAIGRAQAAGVKVAAAAAKSPRTVALRLQP